MKDAIKSISIFIIIYYYYYYYTAVVALQRHDDGADSRHGATSAAHLSVPPTCSSSSSSSRRITNSHECGARAGVRGMTRPSAPLIGPLQCTARSVRVQHVRTHVHFNKKLSYRRVTARCFMSVVIVPVATQQCRNYLYDKS